MTIRAIQPEKIDAWLDALAQAATVYTPQQRVGGDIILAPRGEQGPRRSDYRTTANSPRDILLPQGDEIVRFDAGRGEARLDTTDRVVYGVRPCDAAAVAVADELFLGEPVDPNYAARRNRMKMIVVACEDSAEGCFCISTRTGPVAVAGFDVQLYDLGDVLLAEPGTEAGQALIDAGGERFTDPPVGWEDRLEGFRRRAEEAQPKRYDLDRVRELIDNYDEPEDFWREIAHQCLICAGCAYICPTCTCYNIVDVVEDKDAGRGQRKRLWDSCVLGGFTKEASGHNPRAHHWVRCAHRYQHKLGESSLKDGRFHCVGCGRCVRACISDVGILYVVERLLESDAQK